MRIPGRLVASLAAMLFVAGATACGRDVAPLPVSDESTDDDPLSRIDFAAVSKQATLIYAHARNDLDEDERNKDDSNLRALATAAAFADVMFVGEMVDVRVSQKADGDEMRSRTHYTFQVDRVLKGPAELERAQAERWGAPNDNMPSSNWVPRGQTRVYAITETSFGWLFSTGDSSWQLTENGKINTGFQRVGLDSLAEAIAATEGGD